MQKFCLFAVHLVRCNSRSNLFINNLKGSNLKPSLTSKHYFGSTALQNSIKNNSESIEKPSKEKQLLSSKQRIIKKKTRNESKAASEWFKVKAFATADFYDLETLKKVLLDSSAYDIVEISKDIPENCLFVKAKYTQLNEVEPRQILFFDDGTVVFWNVSNEEQSSVIELLKKHSENFYPMEIIQDESEMLTFSRIDAETKSIDEENLHENNANTKLNKINSTRLVKNHIYFKRFNNFTNTNADELHWLEKYAFSDALKLSVNLSIWELKLENFTEKIEYITDDLKKGKKLKLESEDVLKKLGELYKMRHMVNLNSNFLETPDFYWDREHLENLYTQLYYHLSISKRTRLFNEKLNHCIDLMQILKTHLSDKHHTRLEWIIIWLIAIEVVTALGILEFVKNIFISLIK